MARYTRLTATVIFARGDLDPDVSAAMIALARAGFAVTAMPEAYRPLLCHPRDDSWRRRNGPSSATTKTNKSR